MPPPNAEIVLPEPKAALTEDPPWGVLAVLLIFLFNFLAFNLIAEVVFVALHAIPHFRNLSLNQFAQSSIALFPQSLSYLFTFFLMVLIVQKKSYDRFWEVLKWKWPQQPFFFILGGVGLFGMIQACSLLIPIPKSLPIDRLFRSTSAAWVLAIFGVSIAPLYEELLFRGFLFPALRRYFPLSITVLVDGALFATFHGPQLGWSWAPLLMLFTVGAALTIIRAKTGSLGSTFLVHSAYNAFDFVIIFVATGGFRHMERLH